MSENLDHLREKMIHDQIEARGIRDPLVLEALRKIPRHLFLDPLLWNQAYEDRPIAIGLEQTISQPFMVAYMVEKLEAAGERILEIGTGSGYETAILSQMASEVFTIEIESDLSHRAQKLLGDLGISNVRFRIGNGLDGWPQAAPFARIVVTAAVERVVPALMQQLAVGGRMLVPVGGNKGQKLVRVDRTSRGFDHSELMDVLFVPSHQTAILPPPKTNGHPKPSST